MKAARPFLGVGVGFAAEKLDARYQLFFRGGQSFDTADGFGRRGHLTAPVAGKAPPAAPAAKGGGFIFQSDHSVPGNVAGASYDYVVRLVREHGVYPLRLGEFDLPDIM